MVELAELEEAAPLVVDDQSPQFKDQLLVGVALATDMLVLIDWVTLTVSVIVVVEATVTGV